MAAEGAEALVGREGAEEHGVQRECMFMLYVHACIYVYVHVHVYIRNSRWGANS